jgi:hypothetical protein
MKHIVATADAVVRAVFTYHNGSWYMYAWTKPDLPTDFMQIWKINHHRFAKRSNAANMLRSLRNV